MIHTTMRLFRDCWVRRSTLAATLAALSLPSLSGCAIFAQAMQAIPQVQPAAYKKLANQSVAVMVWAEDSGIEIDWPRIRMDCARMVQNKMLEHQKTDKAVEVKDTKFPIRPESVARLQDDHPTQDARELAPKLGVSRVIYIEIKGFQSRSEASNELFRGDLKGSVSVIEVTEGQATVTYRDDNIRITYPRACPVEGLPSLEDFPVYKGTLDGFTDEICKRFLPHADDPDAPYGSNSDKSAVAFDGK